MPEPEGETESSAAADEAKAAEEAAAEAAEAAAEAQAAAEAEEAAAAEEADRILAEKVAAERAKAKAAEKGKIEERASESDLRMEAAIAHANAMAERRSHKSSEESAGNGAPPAAAPSEAPAAAPTPPESSDVIVDVDLATPGAAKFMDTLSDVGSRVGGLGSDDVRRRARPHRREPLLAPTRVSAAAVRARAAVPRRPPRTQSTPPAPAPPSPALCLSSGTPKLEPKSTSHRLDTPLREQQR